MTLATGEDQAFVGPVLFGRIATARTHLTRVVGIHFDAQTSCQTCFVVQEGTQLSERPLRGVPVSLTLFPARLLAVFAFGALADMGQVFQAHQAVWVRVQNVLTDGMVHNWQNRKPALVLVVDRHISLTPDLPCDG